MDKTDFYNSDSEWLSECCGAVAFGELWENKDGKTAIGVCSDCSEHAGFLKEEE